ncbi:MAG: CHASE2 domain-containing protein [Nitrospinaceae bacterium]
MKRNWVNSFSIALGLTFLSLYTYSLDLDFFQLLEFKSYDLKVRSRGIRSPSGQVVIVAIDEKSLQREGRWPWPRTMMARLVDRLSEAGAAAIGFDIFFPEKDRYVPFEDVKQALRKKDLRGIRGDALIEWLEKVGDSDRIFADAIEKSGRTVLGYFVYATQDLAGSFAEKVSQTHLDLLDFSQYSVIQRFDSPEHPVPLRPIYSVGMSLPELMNAANSSGFVSFIPEMDGVVRWVPLVMGYENFLFPPLSLQTLHEATHLPLGVRVAPFGVDGVRLGEAVIPTSEIGDFLVNYLGPSHTFTHFSASDVLAKKLSADALRNKIVLVGGTAAGTHDMHVSPYGPLFPGVEVHANVMENILQGDFLVRPDWLRLLDMVMILGSGLLLGVVSRYFKAYTMALLLVGGIVGYLLIDFYLFTHEGLWINTIYPVFTQLFVYSGITLYQYAVEERQKRFIKSAFSQYLAPAVVDRLVKNPSLLKLGGERKVLTAFFSDVAGFSTISEKLTPDELVELLNDYLTEMTDILLKYEGTVDKFEGDAIIAFFGAPIPLEDHARRACLASLEMQQRLAELRVEWKRRGKPELFMRIGLNTGPMVVGNMGSRTRMDYTMMGDSVNLAARLEGVNKQYRTHTMISQYTYELSQRDIEVRELDMIRVVGKKEPVKIYELLGKKGEKNGNMLEILPHFNQGIKHYTRRQWAEGIACFEKALEIDDHDGPSLTYRERCIAFQTNPPPRDWDGVFSMTSK